MNIASFFDFVGQFDSDFPRRVVGASKSEIAELERLSGRILPQSYRVFLERMGASDGGLRMGQDSSTLIAEILEYYRDSEREGRIEQSIPSNCIVIAYSGIRTFELCLDFGGELEPSVIYASGLTKKGPCASSLENLLYCSAFLGLGMVRRRCSFVYTARAATISVAAAASALESLGFASRWFSDGVCHCASRGSVFAWVKKMLERPLWVRLSSDEIDDLDQADVEIQSSIPLKLEQRLCK